MTATDAQKTHTSPEEDPSFDDENLNLTDDVFQAAEFVKVGGIFKVHVLLGLILSTASFLVWLFIDFVAYHYPWFVFVAAFFALTITFHFYVFVQRRKTLPLHFAWYLIINTLIFFVWLFSGSSRAWFINPILSWGVLLSWHYIFRRYRNHPDRGFLMHSSFFVLINVMIFVIWLQSQEIFWFIWPFFSLGLFLNIHYHRHFYPQDAFRLHVAIFANVNVMLFFTWVVVGMGFPWWIFPVVTWGIVLTIHGYLAKPKRQIQSRQVNVEDGTVEYSPPPSEIYPTLTPSAPTQDSSFVNG